MKKIWIILLLVFFITDLLYRWLGNYQSWAITIVSKIVMLCWTITFISIIALPFHLIFKEWEEKSS